MRAPPRPEIEAAIAALLDAGDLAGAATLALREYGPELLGYLCAVLRDEDQAADAFSRFAEDLWKGLGSFRRDSTVRTWAYRVAWNAACDELDDPFRRRGRRLDSEEVSALVAAVRSSSAEFLKDGARQRLDALRASLLPDEQTLLVLRLDRGLSWREVAEVLSRPDRPLDEAAARKRFERLKDKLSEKVRGDRGDG
jgi:RNA polymerase sigma-70 factor (ECF subfamily)